MKKFKPMMCPICDGMYFSEPNKDSYEGRIRRIFKCRSAM